MTIGVSLPPCSFFGSPSRSLPLSRCGALHRNHLAPTLRLSPFKEYGIFTKRTNAQPISRRIGFSGRSKSSKLCVVACVMGCVMMEGADFLAPRLFHPLLLFKMFRWLSAPHGVVHVLLHAPSSIGCVAEGQSALAHTCFISPLIKDSL